MSECIECYEEYDPTDAHNPSGMGLCSICYYWLVTKKRHDKEDKRVKR
jgi:hypothetical protein